MKSLNTGFAIMINGTDFYKEEGRICIFSFRDVKIKMAELKSQGYEVSAIPFCREGE